jgi:hypothetical protein
MRAAFGPPFYSHLPRKRTQMSTELAQPAMIRVLGFKSTYERLPVKGDPLDDNIDERGFKLDAKGKRILENQEVDWVHYAPSHAPLTASTWDRVRQINPNDVAHTPKSKDKLAYMSMKWACIEPQYEAWKRGHEIAINGTPLGAWAGTTAEKAEVLRRYGIHTVEEVAHLGESQLEKIPLPAMRAMRKEAKAFLENRGASDAAAREAARDETISALQAKIEEQNERMAAMMDLLEQKTAPDDEAAKLKAELDARGISYHPRHGIETLKKLLADAKTSEAA